eukprot:m.870658 g.870658  ORF g.870658 m.870658 type:complete len:817 (-) comp59755_c0_seq14:123-2573(-)
MEVVQGGYLSRLRRLQAQESGAPPALLRRASLPASSVDPLPPISSEIDHAESFTENDAALARLPRKQARRQWFPKSDELSSISPHPHPPPRAIGRAPIPPLVARQGTTGLPWQQPAALTMAIDHTQDNWLEKYEFPPHDDQRQERHAVHLSRSPQAQAPADQIPDLPRALSFEVDFARSNGPPPPARLSMPFESRRSTKRHSVVDPTILTDEALPPHASHPEPPALPHRPHPPTRPSARSAPAHAAVRQQSVPKMPPIATLEPSNLPHCPALKPSAPREPEINARHAVKPDARIRVCVRKRPLSKKERKHAESDIIDICDNQTLVVKESKVTVQMSKYVQDHDFRFDEVFHEDCVNQDVYHRAVKPLVAHVTHGGRATCFAYGQTGAGKSFTMMGTADQKVPGLYLLAAEDMFAQLDLQTQVNRQVLVSFFEIYCGDLFDLLNARAKLHAREDAKQRVRIRGLTEVVVAQNDALMEIISQGNATRSTGATGANADSSRSHAILQIRIRVTKATYLDEDDGEIGRISFIDLAGSERASDTMDNDKQRRMEGAEINTSLLALKECIRALDQDQKHTPFRQSKLTQVLKDSFIGNSRTCMIANISPSSASGEHTLNTLRYADRVKELGRVGDRALEAAPTAGDSVAEALSATGDVSVGSRQPGQVNTKAQKPEWKSGNGHSPAETALPVIESTANTLSTFEAPRAAHASELDLPEGDKSSLERIGDLSSTAALQRETLGSATSAELGLQDSRRYIALAKAHVTKIAALCEQHMSLCAALSGAPASDQVAASLQYRVDVLALLQAEEALLSEFRDNLGST